MTVAEKEKILKTDKHNLFKDYPWFYNDFFIKVQHSINEFFQRNFKLRFMSISSNENVLLYGDEYFVNKIPVVKNGDLIVKISSNVVGYLLDCSLGVDERKFELNNLTNIEARLIKSLTVYIYGKIENLLNKNEPSKKIIQNSYNYNFTFYIKDEDKHIGKIIFEIPNYLIKNAENVEINDKFSIDDFAGSKVAVSIGVGKSKIALNEIKAIEEGDIILLENSNINFMYVKNETQEYKFKINPNPSLIISIDNNGGNVMEEDTSVKSQNMWDSILVDIVAEFDNVKLTLGELKQISEGLVIDVGCVYDHKIKLRVENQVIATGELVILDDRYGVRIDSVKKNKNSASKTAAAEKDSTDKAENETAKEKAPQEQKAQNTAKPANAGAEKKVKNPQAKQGDENFDYSDFEIEDESI